MSCCIVRKVGYQRRRIKSERDEGKEKVQQASDIDQESTGDARVWLWTRDGSSSPPRSATCAPLPPRSLATGAQLPCLGLPSARDVGPLPAACCHSAMRPQRGTTVIHRVRSPCFLHGRRYASSSMIRLCRAFCQYVSYIHLLFQSFVDEDLQASVRNQGFMGTSRRGEDSLAEPLA